MRKKWMASLLMVLLSGCGSGSSGVSGTSSGSISCASGYVYSSIYGGCLLQSSCASGYGLYNGACVLLSNTTTTSSGCVSVNQSIPFYGSGMTLDSYGTIYGGTIPNSSTYGTMTVGTSTSVSGTTFSSMNSATTYYGSLQMTVSGLTAGTSNTASGTLTIGSYDQQLISSYASTSGYGANSSGVACVSGIAVQGRLYSYGSNWFSGYVYLYLNGTQHGYMLAF